MDTTRSHLALPSLRFPAALAAVLLAAQAGAQAEIKAKVHDIDVEMQETPRYNLSSATTTKRVPVPRKWLQVDVVFEADSSNTKTDFIDSLQFKYFLIFDTPDKELQKKIFVATIDHVNVPKGEKFYSSVYVSPTSLDRLFGAGKSRTVNARDAAIAVEIHAGGELVGGDATAKKSSRWWQGKTRTPVTGVVVSKTKTPFAPLWFDIYAEEKE